MESTICLLTEWTQKAGGHFKVDDVFLIRKGACAVVEDIALHLEREFGHGPRSNADALASQKKSNNLSSTLVMDEDKLKRNEKTIANKVTPVCLIKEEVYIWCKHQANFDHQTR